MTTEPSCWPGSVQGALLQRQRSGRQESSQAFNRKLGGIIRRGFLRPSHCRIRQHSPASLAHQSALPPGDGAGKPGCQMVQSLKCLREDFPYCCPAASPASRVTIPGRRSVDCRCRPGGGCSPLRTLAWPLTALAPYGLRSGTAARAGIRRAGGTVEQAGGTDLPDKAFMIRRPRTISHLGWFLGKRAQYPPGRKYSAAGSTSGWCVRPLDDCGALAAEAHSRIHKACATGRENQVNHLSPGPAPGKHTGLRRTDRVTAPGWKTATELVSSTRRPRFKASPGGQRPRAGSDGTQRQKARSNQPAKCRS